MYRWIDLRAFKQPQPHGPTRQILVPSGSMWDLKAIASATLTCSRGVMFLADE
jgi:hypothetical protein